MSSRHSLANIHRQVKGALGSTTLTSIRYGKRPEIELRLRLVRKSLLEALKQLRFAQGDVQAQ